MAGNSLTRRPSRACVLAANSARHAGKSRPRRLRGILLALGAGLRRAEIDGLQKQNLMRDKGIVRVTTTAQARTKSVESEGDVHVDDGVFAELERVLREGSTLHLIGLPAMPTLIVSTPSCARRALRQRNHCTPCARNSGL